MLDRTRSRFHAHDVEAMALLTGVDISALVDGAAMVSVLDPATGEFAVRPSNGAADGRFVGFLLNDNKVSFSTRNTIQGKIKASGTTLQLPQEPVSAADITLKDAGTALVVGEIPLEAGEYSRVGKTVTLHTTQSGKEIEYVIRYAMTASESQRRFGHVLPGAPIMTMMNRVSIIRRGSIYTDQFKMGIGWDAADTNAAAELIKAGANGLLTVNENGAIIPNAAIIGLPKGNPATLGIMFG